MEGRFAEEIYGESSLLSKIEVKSVSAEDQEDNLNDCDHGHANLNDSVWDDSDEMFDKTSDLEREWLRRHGQFHTMGYRDGLIKGKEAAAQEGFNIGFKQSVLHGYRWGHVRGVTSAFSSLPDQLKEKLVETPEKSEEFQGLYESVHSLSTIDALRMFNDDNKAREGLEDSEQVEVSPKVADLLDQTSCGSHLGSYVGQLESLIKESPALDIQIPEPK